MAQDPQQRTLTIEARQIDSNVQVSVRDTGVGVAEDKLDQIFNGFYTTKPHGLGVGLEVCRSIMESHGGKIWAENNEKQGITINFALPNPRV